METKLQEVQYREYTFRPRNESSWPEKDRYGYWVVRDGCNAMPGACWFKTEDEAIRGVEALEAAHGDADLFWLLLGHAGLETTEKAPATGVVTTVYLNAHVWYEPEKVTCKGMPPLSPKEALALAAMLRAAAKHALGMDFLSHLEREKAHEGKRTGV